MEKKKLTLNEFMNIVTAIGTAVALVLLAFGFLSYGDGPNVPTARGVTNFDSLTLSDNLVVGGTSSVTGASTLTGAVTAAGAVTATGALVASNDLTVDDTFNIDDTAYTLTGTQTLTPTASFYLLNPATTLTLTLATGSATVGDLLILYNTVTTSTVVVDTTATVGGGNVTLGQNDLAVFIFANSVWAEVASPDNS